MIKGKDTQHIDYLGDEDDDESEEEGDNSNEPDDEEIFEVENIIGICYGEPKEKERGLYLKVWIMNDWTNVERISNFMKLQDVITISFQDSQYYMQLLDLQMFKFCLWESWMKGPNDEILNKQSTLKAQALTEHNVLFHILIIIDAERLGTKV